MLTLNKRCSNKHEGFFFEGMALRSQRSWIYSGVFSTGSTGKLYLIMLNNLLHPWGSMTEGSLDCDLVAYSDGIEDMVQLQIALGRMEHYLDEEVQVVRCICSSCSVGLHQELWLDIGADGERSEMDEEVSNMWACTSVEGVGGVDGWCGHVPTTMRYRAFIQIVAVFSSW